MGNDIVSARDLMVAALEMLDACGAPPEIGAHLDWAVHQVNDYIASSCDGVSEADVNNSK